MTVHPPAPLIRKWHVVLVICATTVVIAMFYVHRREAVEVRVISPDYQDLESTISTVGSVVPVDEYPARAQFSGMVEKIDVQLGQRVHPGQLLVTMKDQYALSRLITAQASLDSAMVGEQNVEHNGSQEDRIQFSADRDKAQAEQKAAASALVTARELLTRGSVSQAEVDAAEQRLHAADATVQTMNERDAHRYSKQDLASWKEKVDAAKASLQAEKVSYHNANITSPIAGTAYVIPVSPYDFVPAGADLVRVADLTKVLVRADFDEPDIAILHNGQPVTISWDGRPGRTWHGHVTHAPLAVTGTGARNVGQCTIGVDDASGDLPADSHVTVIVTVAKHSHALTIPREALHTEGSSRFVYKVVSGKLRKADVRVGLANVARAEITSGVSPADELALRPVHADELSDGLHVVVVQ